MWAGETVRGRGSEGGRPDSDGYDLFECAAKNRNGMRDGDYEKMRGGHTKVTQRALSRPNYAVRCKKEGEKGQGGPWTRQNTPLRIN